MSEQSADYERVQRHVLKLRDAEQLARFFHEEYERLAPDYAYETRRESAVPWDQVPRQNRRLMVAVAMSILTRYGARIDGSGRANRG